MRKLNPSKEVNTIPARFPKPIGRDFAYTNLYEFTEQLLIQYDELVTHAASLEQSLTDTIEHREHWREVAERYFNHNKYAIFGKHADIGKRMIPTFKKPYDKNT